ncbi:NAD-dependent epimerase/dehydratase family protein [Cytobacillus spongiae]|uniref:NAD-dependent epimerase/dehydratase family protein n=1 Tax=Cytobacillus spongiae TaxID=2901381 RepID=UPI001F2547B5|nr:NAD-dependent epimerase/dehydratase family protein [Cytobacillus spongiae]UII56487.1 NAD-dependent epimerase/dehydratase family protein [Cytobacillus spongiae]
MKKVAVLGATGSMGYALVEALVNRNIMTVAFARSEAKLTEYKETWGPLAEIIPGDVTNPSDLKRIISSVDTVIHTLNVPYQDWDPTLTTILTNILQECRNQNASLLYVDNIYSYGYQHAKATEQSPKLPHTKKGKIRLQLQTLIEESGVPYVIAHFPDFYGPKAGSTVLQYTFEQLSKKNTVGFVGDLTVPREFIYTKDGAEAFVDLALHQEAYGQIWNIAGAGTITGLEIQEIASSYLNRKVTFKPIRKWMIKAFGLINPFMKEYVEMLYLNETPVILDGSKYETIIGPIPKTPYSIGFQETFNDLLKE